MTLAHHDIERQVAAAVAAPAPARTHVLVVAHTPGVGSAMTAEMAQDAAVSGRVSHGTLSDVLSGNTEDWSAIDYVAFEASTDTRSDVAAVCELLSLPGVNLRCIVIASRPLLDEAAYRDAGVADVLPVALPTPVQPTPDTVDAGGDLTVIMRARGGAGATTLAVNLAIAQAQTSDAGRTALVDMDIQNGTVALSLDLPDSPDATQFVKGETAGTKTFLGDAMKRHSTGLDVLCAPDVFAPLTAIRPDAVTELLNNLKARYDHIVIDMPQAVVDWIDPVLDGAARVLVVSDTSLPSVKRTRRLIDLIGEEHMTLPVQIVINHQKRPRVKSAAVREIERLIGRPLNHWVPTDAKAARRATDMGEPLLIGAKRSGPARAILSLAQSVFVTAKQGK